MADTIQFELVSPQRLLKSEPVEMVVVPGGEGDIGVLPGHSLLIGTVRPGVIQIHEGGQVRESIFIAGGFVEVNPEACTVLAEAAMPVSDLDRDDVAKRIEKAKQALVDAGDDEKAKTDAENRMAVAEAMRAALG